MVSKAMKSAPMPKTKKPAAKAPAAKAPAPKPVGFQPRVCWDDQRRTCIELDRADGQTKYIPLDILGFELLSTSVVELDRQFSETPDYPVEKAAQLYAEYAVDLGGTLEAMQALAKLTNLTEKEITMATAKKATTAAKTTTAAAKKVPLGKKVADATTKAKAPATKAAAAKPATKAAPAKAKAPAGEKKPKASEMFKTLIREGKLTDEQIFAKVQKEFGLDDSKKSYVKWYRNDMTKKGEKLPKPKV